MSWRTTIGVRYDEPRVNLKLHLDNNAMALVPRFLEALMDSTLKPQVCCAAYKQFPFSMGTEYLKFPCTKSGQIGFGFKVDYGMWRKEHLSSYTKAVNVCYAVIVPAICENRECATYRRNGNFHSQ